jgi:hypothetical protein
MPSDLQLLTEAELLVLADEYSHVSLGTSTQQLTKAPPCEG